MNKREYLAKLREYLSYELPERLVTKNLDYYADYIDREVQNGRSQAAVLEDLGDPQLIARSIIDAAKSGADGIPYTDDDEDFTGEIYGTAGRQQTSGSDRTASGYGSASDSRQGYDRGNTGGTYGTGGGNRTYGRSGQTERTEAQQSPFGGIRTYNFGCFSGILILLVVFCVLSVLGSLIGLLSPVLAPVCMVLLIVWLLNRRGRW